MTEKELQAVVGRAKTDEDFAQRLFKHFEPTLTAEGYTLSDGQADRIKQALSDNQETAPPLPLGELLKNQAADLKLARHRMEKQTARVDELGDYTIKLLKDTLGHAAYTFKIISWMNVTMFLTGIALFIAAAIYAAVAHEKIYSLLFGGLGALSFIALFLLGPIDKSQNALSNLVQVEIAFMNFFEQLAMWDGYAALPRGNPPAVDPAAIEHASEMLQKRSLEIVDMLQVYVETRERDNGGRQSRHVTGKE